MSAPTLEILVIKDGGNRKSEPFSHDKLLKSIEASCRGVNISSGATQDIAARVAARVTQWLTQKSEVTSSDLRHRTTETLTQLCPEAGYLYQHHNTML